MEKKNKWLKTENILLLVFVAHAVVSFIVVCFEFTYGWLADGNSNYGILDYSSLAWLLVLLYAVLKGLLDVFKSNDFSTKKSLEFETKLEDLKTEVKELGEKIRKARMAGEM